MAAAGCALNVSRDACRQQLHPPYGVSVSTPASASLSTSPSAAPAAAPAAPVLPGGVTGWVCPGVTPEPVAGFAPRPAVAGAWASVPAVGAAPPWGAPGLLGKDESAPRGGSKSGLMHDGVPRPSPIAHANAPSILAVVLRRSRSMRTLAPRFVDETQNSGWRSQRGQALLPDNPAAVCRGRLQRHSRRRTKAWKIAARTRARSLSAQESAATVTDTLRP